MTNGPINSFKKGTRCKICTGCGRCFGGGKPDVVCAFFPEELFPPQYPPISGENGGEEEECVVAADIGTTTIAMQLRQTADGRILDTFTCLNPQRNYGADVLSRIEAAERPEAAQDMKRAVREALGQGISRFRRRLSVLQMQTADTEKKPVLKRLVIAGNTTMAHLFMGYDVSGMGRYPFTPCTLSAVRTRFLELDTLVMPGASAFIGGDIVADIHALRMDEREEITLLLDLGTNGEMVLGNRNRLVAAAAAAGPAFEGSGGTYGADLMALTARLLEEGLLDSTGLLAEPYFTNGVEIGGVRLTGRHIRQLQMAKSAIATGIRILCGKYGITDMGSVAGVWLAGGMGYYLDAKAAAAVGLFPRELEDRTRPVGNAVLEGAFLYGREDASGAPPKVPAIEVYNLAEEPDFQEKYIAGMELCPCK